MNAIDLPALCSSPAVSSFAKRFAAFFAKRHAEAIGADADTFAGLLALLLHCVDRGHVFLDLTNPPPIQHGDAFFSVRIPDLTTITAILSKAAPDVAIDLSSPTELPFVFQSHPAPRLFLHRYWRYERNLESAFRALLDRPAQPQSPEAIDAIFSPAERESPQCRAARNALQCPVSILAGGPGTGKTTTAVKILAARLAANPSTRIALAAPTGKAAARMKEAISNAIPALESAQLPPATLAHIAALEASTIHRLLGTVFNKPWFFHSATNPLPFDFIVIDECSMIDLPLMAKLIDAIPTSGQILLIGDPHQLPPVELGSVFGDLLRCDALAPGITHLSKNFRAKDAPAIVDLCHFINQGPRAESAFFDLLAAPNPNVRWVPIQSPADTAPLYAEATKAFKQRLQLPVALPHDQPLDPALFHNANAFRILTALRQGPFGAAALNRALQQPLHNAFELRIVTRNDPEVGLFNGDVGLQFVHQGHPVIAFPGRKPISIHRVPTNEPAYAMTGHRAQGSEFDSVHVVLPVDVHCPILTREWLYTAASRARTHLTIWASEAALRTCLHTPTRRASSLFS